MNAGHHNLSDGVQAGGPGQPADAQGFARGEWRIGNSRTLKLSVHQGVWPWMPPPSTPGILVLRERLHIRRKQDPRGRDLSRTIVSVVVSFLGGVGSMSTRRQRCWFSQTSSHEFPSS